MSESFYICRTKLDHKSKESRFTYMSPVGGWCSKLVDAKPFPSKDAAVMALRGRDHFGNIWSESDVKASPYYKVEMKNESPQKALEVEVIKPAKPAIVPKLKDDSDTKTAKALTKLFTDAQNGMRKIIALGLFAWEVKETKLKHGEFGPWLAAHCPKLTTIDSVTGKTKPSRALQGYMALTQNVLESAGYKTMEKYLATAGKCANDAHLGAGKFLLIADKKVPDDLKEVHEKICSLVDGKTQRQLFLEFKQADEDGDGNATVKRGRVKGSGGATKEQRELAALKAEEERLAAIEIQTTETTAWLLNNSDAKHLGMMDDKVLIKLQEATQTCSGFITRLLEARKGGAQ